MSFTSENNLEFSRELRGFCQGDSTNGSLMSTDDCFSFNLRLK